MPPYFGNNDLAQTACPGVTEGANIGGRGGRRSV
jgi:hypothetical protein